MVARLMPIYSFVYGQGWTKLGDARSSSWNYMDLGQRSMASYFGELVRSKAESAARNWWWQLRFKPDPLPTKWGSY
jgi:hypothetical protein